MRSMKFWHRLLQCNGNRNTTNKYFFSGWFLFLSNFFYGKSDPEWYTVKLYINTEEMRKSTKVLKVGLQNTFSSKKCTALSTIFCNCFGRLALYCTVIFVCSLVLLFTACNSSKVNILMFMLVSFVVLINTQVPFSAAIS